MARRIRKNSNKKASCPSFFKRIPPPFLKFIRNDLSEKATLNSNTCSERSWNVRVLTSKGGVYFKDGWQEFLSDNSVEDGEFVVFEYEGNMHFSTQIYDNSCCEKDTSPHIGTHTKSTFAECKKRHAGRPRKSDTGNRPLPLNSGKHISDNIARKRLPGRPRNSHVSCSKCPCPRPCPVNSSKDNSDNIAKKRLPGRPRKSHVGRSKVPCSFNSSKDNSESFKSNYPHCTKVVRETFCIYSFPTSFYREHLSPGNHKVLLLKIAKGHKWYQVNLVRSCASAYLSKGWSEFACANQIKVGNVCVFEAVGENKLVVHIFRQ